MGEDANGAGWLRGEGETARRIRQLDWATTPLGAIETWPQSLRTAVELMLATPGPVSVMWGPERIQLYNDAYIAVADDRHPAALGRPTAENWPEAYAAFLGPALDAAFQGRPTSMDRQAIPLRTRDGRTETRVFTATFTPIRDEAGAVGGVFHPLVELTAQVRAEAALRETELRQRLILETAVDYAIFTTDAEGVITDWPPGAQAVFGGTREEMIGRDAALLFTPEDREQGAPEQERAEAREKGQAPDVRWHLRVDGSPVFIHGYVRPLPADQGGALSGFLKVGQDVTEQRRVHEALRESEERFRLIVESALDYAIFTTDPDGVITEWPPGAQAVFGGSEAEMIGRDVAETFVPEDREARQPEKERATARETGHAPDVRWHQRMDGRQVFIEGSARPLRNGKVGEARGFLKIGRDATEQRRVQHALRESEERFRQFSDASTDVLWIRDARTLAFEYVSPAFETVYGLGREALLNGDHVLNWTRLIHPEDSERALANILRVGRGERVDHEFRVRRPSDGQVRWVFDSSFPMLDDSGRVQRIAGVGKDITELRRATEHQRLLLAELQHRVRNTLGVVRSIARRTAKTSVTPEEYALHLDGRINALARTQAVLTRAPGRGVDLESMIREELVAHAAPDEQVTVEGPPVRLQAKPAETLALAMHELTTNAVKYGALSAPEGRITVVWSLDGEPSDGCLRLDWREIGVRAGDRPRRRGFGLDLIERTVPYELGAKAEIEFAPDGFRCVFHIPLNVRNVVPAETGAGDEDG
jgi:PAS domain S-box-containing protein